MLSYKYYDTPEGQDIYKKAFVLSKYAAMSGLAIASLDVLTFSHPKGVFNTVYRYMWYMGPMVGMATAFTVTANMSQRVREKNDKLNYFLGGVAAGSVFGAWARSPVLGVPISVVLGAIAVARKTTVDEGWNLIPEVSTMTKTAISARNDWTMAKDIEELKTWSNGN